MSMFDPISKVIKRIEQQYLRGPAATLNAMKLARLNSLTSDYFSLEKRATVIDYSTPITQFCYAYKYVAAHAYYMRAMLSFAQRERGTPLFPGPILRVACIGGGPGSDIVGIVEFLKRLGTACAVKEIQAVVFDKEPAWEENLHALIAELNTEIQVDVSFCQIDATDVMSWAGIDFSCFDLVTTSFFASEITKIGNGKAADPFWNYMISSLSKGSILAYIDNSTDTFSEYFDKICASNGSFSVIGQTDQAILRCPDGWDLVQDIIQSLDHRPKLRGDVAYRVLEKV